MPTVAGVLGLVIRLGLMGVAAYLAYDIRMYAIRIYGRLIHEFDPWFNYRATEYLHANGLKKFFTWFDHTVWYPLGRPVGTTIYPGMQLTSVAIWHVLNRLGQFFPQVRMSLNDVCVFVPTWFGAVASLITGLLAAECSGIPSAAPAAALVMAVIPAHIMRSVGGGYDNESIAVTAMVLTFYLWNRSLRNADSWPVAVAAGLAHVYMVAAWGGYVFVINVIGAHAALLLLLGRYDESIYKAYTLFYTIGTLGAMQVPCVAWTPLKSLEQIGPLAVFGIYQVLGLCEVLRKQQGLAKGSREYNVLRTKVLLVAGGGIAVVLSMLVQAGHFGPVSARVRGLFIKHMRTGNPLVDSVAEHQPTNPDAYWLYLNIMCYVAPVGWVLLFFKPTNSKIFLIMYTAFGYFFSAKMNRLIILMGPIASAVGGVALGAAVDWALSQYKVIVEHRKIWARSSVAAAADSSNATAAEANGTAAAAFANGEETSKADDSTPAKSAKKPAGASPAKSAKVPRAAKPSGVSVALKSISDALEYLYNHPISRILRLVLAIAVLVVIPYYGLAFFQFSHMFAMRSSNPSIVFQARLNTGETIIVTDYLDAYHWLRRNTPEGSRVLSWWDYGYQISGIANRTTLADGNTWNHEHIALVGRCLTSEEKKAHKLVRHLADYVLVWSGGGGDDLAKSPHIARIGNSVYPDICPNDPLCYSFSIDRQGNPTPTMARSLLFKLTENGNRPGVTVNSTLFQEVHTSKYRKVRIYKVKKVSKKSKAWALDPANRLCDRPGSWYCPGQYPPDLPVKIGKGHATLDYDAHGLKGNQRH